MLNALRGLFREKYLNIQAKLVFPLAITILLLVAVLSPLTNRIINSRIEEDADRRLGEVAKSVAALIENSEALARNNAALLAEQPDTIEAFNDLNNAAAPLFENRASLNLQELSLYSADFQSGDAAYFYGGPTVTRRLQVSEDANRIREELILAVLESETAASNVTVAPQNSQIIGAAPVFDSSGSRVLGVVVAAFYMDQAFIDNISGIIDTDVAIVKDNAVIVSTIDAGAGIETLINQGWLNTGDIPTTNMTYSGGEEYRLLGRSLEIGGVPQGSVLVAQPIDNLFTLSRSIQIVLFTVTSIFALTALWFWISAFITFTRPLSQLTDATTKMSQGDLNQKVKPSFWLFRDEITVLTENFNKMAENLRTSYASLEEKVKQRTQELAVAHDEAVAANKSKSEFVSIVSHELKLPMTSIKGYSDLMLGGATGPLTENQVTFLTTIRNNVNRMAALVSDLTEISRIESGNLRIEPRAVPVWDAIDEVVTLTKTQIAEKKQTITVDIPEKLPKSWCDRGRFVQIITNLISNANKYSPEGAHIFVQAVRADEMIKIKVQDNGYGMTLEDQRLLFSKFFRSGDEKVRETPGTGLGMSITKNLVELQGGKIWFESEYRKGTTFYFTVPVYKDGNALAENQ